MAAQRAVNTSNWAWPGLQPHATSSVTPRRGGTPTQRDGLEQLNSAAGSVRQRQGLRPWNHRENETILTPGDIQNLMCRTGGNLAAITDPWRAATCTARHGPAARPCRPDGFRRITWRRRGRSATTCCTGCTTTARIRGSAGLRRTPRRRTSGPAYFYNFSRSHGLYAVAAFDEEQRPVAHELSSPLLRPAGRRALARTRPPATGHASHFLAFRIMKNGRQGAPFSLLPPATASDPLWVFKAILCLVTGGLEQIRSASSGKVIQGARRPRTRFPTLARRASMKKSLIHWR